MNDIKPFQYRDYKVRACKKGYECKNVTYAYAVKYNGDYEVYFNTPQDAKNFIDTLLD